MIFSFSFGLEEENIFRMSANLDPLFFHSRSKDSNNRISKKESLESENYFSKNVFIFGNHFFTFSSHSSGGGSPKESKYSK